MTRRSNGWQETMRVPNSRWRWGFSSACQTSLALTETGIERPTLYFDEFTFARLNFHSLSLPSSIRGASGFRMRGCPRMWYPIALRRRFRWERNAIPCLSGTGCQKCMLLLKMLTSLGPITRRISNKHRTIGPHRAGLAVGVMLGGKYWPPALPHAPITFLIPPLHNPEHFGIKDRVEDKWTSV